MSITNLPAKHSQPPFQIVPASIIHCWPVGTFVENLAVLDDGSIVVSVHSTATIEHISSSGFNKLLAQLPMPVSGLIAASDHLYACGGAIGQTPGYVWKISIDGTFEEHLRVDEAIFLNGFTAIRPGIAFAVDSLLGVIFEIDLISRSYRQWLQHPLLTKCSDEPMLPGVNGIKAFRDSVIVTNTDRALVLSINIQPDGNPGSVSVLAEALRGDDIAFDESGTLYVTTHIHNSLVQVSLTGERVAIAGPEQGMSGATACAFGRTPIDSQSLYVTTTGGVIMPFEGELQPAKLVRLDVATRGYRMPSIMP